MKLYQEVTDRILAELETGAAPWLCPWTKSKANGTGIMPSNAITSRSYHGINVLILWGSACRQGLRNQHLAHLQAGSGEWGIGPQGREGHPGCVHQKAPYQGRGD